MHCPNWLWKKAHHGARLLHHDALWSTQWHGCSVRCADPKGADTTSPPEREKANPKTLKSRSWMAHARAGVPKKLKMMLTKNASTFVIYDPADKRLSDMDGNVLSD